MFVTALLVALLFAPPAASQDNASAPAVPSAKAQERKHRMMRRKAARTGGKSKWGGALKSKNKSKTKIRGPGGPNTAGASNIDGIPGLMTRWLVFERTQSVEDYLNKARREGTAGERSLDALQGAIWSTDGRHAEAVLLLEQAEGSPYYEAIGLRYHARSLYELGHQGEAVALWTEYERTSPARDQVLEGVRMDRALALLSLGDEATAWSDTDAATAETVSAGRAWTRQLHLCLQDDDLDCAWSVHDMASREDAVRSASLQTARFWLLVESGLYRDALALQEEIGPHHGGRPHYWTSRLELALRTDNPAEVIRLLDRKRFNRDQDPAHRAFRAWAEHLLGSSTAAADLALLAADHPTNRLVLRAHAAVGG